MCTLEVRNYDQNEKFNEPLVSQRSDDFNINACHFLRNFFSLVRSKILQVKKTNAG